MEVIAVTALAAVPITHGVAGHRLLENATNTWRFKNIFFSGGYRFMTFQGFSWSFFVLALVLALGRMFLHVDQMSVVRTHVNERSLLGGSICSALISEVLMVSSLLTYHRGHHARPGQGHRRTPSAMLQVLQTSGTAIITSLCFILALVGFGLLMTAHRSQAKSPIEHSQAKDRKLEFPNERPQATFHKQTVLRERFQTEDANQYFII